MWWSSLLSLLLWSRPGHAGACCVGATSTVPSRLGECESVLVGVGVRASQATRWWDTDGAGHTGSLQEQTLESVLAMGWRWDRAGQAWLTLPAQSTWRTAGTLAESGGGVGDVRAGVLWDPLPEHPDSRWPVPVLSLGVRLPTGRDWSASDAPLQSDVTGVSGAAVVGVLTAQRSLGRTPWSLGLDTEQGPLSPPLYGATASVGRYLGTRWSLSAALRHSRTTLPGTVGAARSTASVRVTHGQMLRWRAWTGVDVDLLGRDYPQRIQASLGIAWIR